MFLSAPHFFVDFLEKDVYDGHGNQKCGSRGVRQYPTACVRVFRPLVHSSFCCTATFIIVSFPAFDKRKRRLVSLCSHVVAFDKRGV